MAYALQSTVRIRLQMIFHPPRKDAIPTELPKGTQTLINAAINAGTAFTGGAAVSLPAAQYATGSQLAINVTRPSIGWAYGHLVGTAIDKFFFKKRHLFRTHTAQAD